MRFGSKIFLSAVFLGALSGQALSADRICDSADPGYAQCVDRYFKNTPEASVFRGRIVYENYCMLCHGKSGLGDGRAARLHDPRPFDLTASVAPSAYLEEVVRKGGEKMGRGVGMPPWGEQLTDEQIRDVMNYLYSIRKYKE